jgi:hypothetical protein
MAPKRRRASGEGAVFKRASDGLWVGMLDLGIADGRRRRKAVYGQVNVMWSGSSARSGQHTTAG